MEHKTNVMRMLDKNKVAYTAGFELADVTTA